MPQEVECVAIVKTYIFPEGTVHIDDDCDRDASAEERTRRIEQVRKVAAEIISAERIRRAAGNGA